MSLSVIDLHNQVAAAVSGARNGNLSIAQLRANLANVKQSCKIQMDRLRIEHQESIKGFTRGLVVASLVFKTRRSVWPGRTMQRDNQASLLHPYKRIQILIDEILLGLKTASPGKEIESLPSLAFQDEEIANVEMASNAKKQAWGWALAAIVIVVAKILSAKSLHF